MPGDLARLKSRGSAEGHNGEFPGVHPALDRHEPDTLGYGGGNQPAHAIGRLYRGDSQGSGDAFLQSLLSDRGVQRSPPTQEILRVQVAQHEVRVGHRWVVAAFPIACRTRVRPGAVRPHVEYPALIHPGNATPSGSEGVDVNHRHGNLPSGLELLGGQVGNTVFDQGDVGAGPAHVKGDGLRLAQSFSQRGHRVHPTRGAGQDRPHRLAHGLFDGGDPSIGLHDQHVADPPVRVKPLPQPVQILAKHRADVGVDDRGAKPVEFLDLGNYLLGKRSVDPRKPGADPLRGHPFVNRVQVREEEAHRKGLHLLFLHSVQRPVQIIKIQGRVDTPVSSDTLGDAKAEIPGHQRLKGRHSQIVPVLFQPLPHFQQVSETFRRDQSDP